MAESAGERSEQPTARRLNEARRDGNVAKSQDLTSAAVLCGAVVLMYYGGRVVIAKLRVMTIQFLEPSPVVNPTRAGDMSELVRALLRVMAETAVPLMIGVAIVALVINLLQVGFMLTGKPLVPKLSKLNPIKGAKRMVDLKSFMRLAMSILKLIVVAVIAVILIRQDIDKILHLGDMAAIASFAQMAQMMFWLAVKLTAVLLLIALLDFWYQRWQRIADMKMSKQEVEDETKSMDGDPKMKQRRAQVAKQLAMQRMAAAVPGADVVVTNPTHFSVAIKYDASQMPAPKVVAKGADYMAFRIREIAMANGIPLVEKKPLARALYANVEVGEYIPPEHYAAAAEILAYVYRLSEETSEQSTMPSQFAGV